MGESRAEAPRSLSPGDRIGPLEVIAPVGTGGMGEVYRARDGRLHRDVALKIVAPRFALDAGRLARFKREAQILAALNHPNIDAASGVRVLSQRLVIEPFTPPLYDDYDVHPDGKTLALVRPAGEARGREITVVLNWVTELQRVPGQ